ncbi:MAG: hypothetical protein HY426_02360 [Candidatus Levybacteria bacterium]|nr:hypothetical protein [Candidatus Levybacteria bacterium]
MTVNESKARPDSPQWANWRKSPPGAIGTMETARARQRVIEFPRLDHHLASSLVSGNEGRRILVTTLELENPDRSTFNIMPFELPVEMGEITLEKLTDPSADLRKPAELEIQPYLDVIKDSVSDALRQHKRTVRVVSMMLGNPKI